MLNFLLEEELSDHEASFGVFVDGFVVDCLFGFFQLVLISDVAMEKGLSWAVLVGLEGLPNSEVLV